jgi:hypothetical protein
MILDVEDQPEFFDLTRELCRFASGGVIAEDNDEGFNIAMLGACSLAVDAQDVNLFNALALRRLVETAGFEVLIGHTPGSLDAEFVGKAALKGEVRLDPFLHPALVEEWERLGWPYQMFLAEQGLSSHMWLAAWRDA